MRFLISPRITLHSIQRRFSITKACLILLWLTIFLSLNIDAAVPIQPDVKIPYIYTPILLYHRVIPKVSSIYDVTPAMFEKQIKFILEQGYQPITALQYIKLQKQPQFFPNKPVILTFDDGSKSHYQYVFPLLQKYHIEATFFVYPDVIVNKSNKLITWTELNHMARNGMDIESHTMSHPYLAKLHTSPDDPHYLSWLDHELKDSKMIIEKHLNVEVPLLAYSFGWFSSVVETKSIEAGYQGMFTINWGANRVDENPFRLKRRVVSNNMSQTEMGRYLSSRPLSLDIITPTDAAIIVAIPIVKFRLVNRELNLVDIMVGNNKGSIRPDHQGVFTFKVKKLYSGYNMITISGYNDDKQLFMSSWGFFYNPPVPVPSNKAY